MNTGKAGVLVMTGLLAIYLVFIVQYGFVLIGTGEPIGIAMGIALLVIPLIGGWVIVRELLFVRSAGRLLEVLRKEGGLPVDDLPRLPSGRAVAEAADAQFPQYKEAVEAAPETSSVAGSSVAAMSSGVSSTGSSETGKGEQRPC